MCCDYCKAVYSVDEQCCPVCREPNPLWEKAMAAKLLDENMGDEAAWTGVPRL